MGSLRRRLIPLSSGRHPLCIGVPLAQPSQEGLWRSAPGSALTTEAYRSDAVGPNGLMKTPLLLQFGHLIADDLTEPCIEPSI